MKRLKTKLLIIFIFINVLIIGLIPINVKAVDDIDFIFNRDILVDSSSASFDNEFNLRPQSAYLAHYNATYGFLDIPDGTQDTSIDFIDSATTGIDTTLQIIAIQNSHRKLLEVFDNDSIARVDFSHDFSAQTFGTIEFWFSTSDTNKNTQLRLRTGATITVLFIFRMSGGNFELRNSGSWSSIFTAVNEQWYHIRVDFECSNSGYLGLNQFEYTVSINSTSFFVGDSFESNQINIDEFFAFTDVSDNNYFNYYDAYGESWSAFYNINDNILPILESSESILEVDKDEFALVDTNTFYTLGSHSSYDGWIPDISGGVINIVNGDDVVNDRELSFVIAGGGDNPNITKNIVNVAGFDFYMVSQKLTVRETLGAGQFETYLYSDANIKISGFKVDLTNATHMEIDLWSQGFFPVLEFISLAGIPIMEISLLVNYEIDIAILNISINDVFNTTFIKGLHSTGRSGLSRVDSGLTGGFAMEFYLDNTVVYFGGHSYAEGLGFATIDLGVAEWNTELNNLFTTQINGNLSIGTVEGSYTISESFNELNDFFLFTNISQFNNVYESVITEVSNPTFVFTLNGTLFSINTFLIEGVILNENGNEYRLDFTFGNVNIQESYFFVNTANELRFINQVDDNLTEFIQARFNINDVSSNEFAVRYKSIRSGNSIGNLRINFTTTSNILEIPIVEQTRRVVLTQNRTIRDIIILISDGGLLTSGITTGFISDISFIDSLSVDTSFLTISIIDMLIPLIMILIPTLAISDRYGKDFIVPLFLLMSIVLTATSIIPIWLFFIIGLTNSLFIYLRKGKLE